MTPSSINNMQRLIRLHPLCGFVSQSPGLVLSRWNQQTVTSDPLRRCGQRRLSSALKKNHTLLRRRTAPTCVAMASSANDRVNNGGDERAVGKTFRLAPSDFAFIWEECKRCFYLKNHGVLYRPRMPFPSIFGTIDLAMKRHFRGLRTTDVIPEMQPGVFLCEDNDAWVESLPIRSLERAADNPNQVIVRGMIDCLVRYDDDTYGIIDFKTSNASQKSVEMYSRQLHAYAMALENPAPRSDLQTCKISTLGLIIYTPSDFHTPVTEDKSIMAALTGKLTYLPVERDDDTFRRFLSTVLQVLSTGDAQPPPPSPRCPYCEYVKKVNTLKLQ